MPCDHAAKMVGEFKLGLVHGHLSFPIQNEILQLAIRILYVCEPIFGVFYQSHSLPQKAGAPKQSS